MNHVLDQIKGMTLRTDGYGTVTFVTWSHIGGKYNEQA